MLRYPKLDYANIAGGCEARGEWLSAWRIYERILLCCKLTKRERAWAKARSVAMDTKMSEQEN